MNTIKDYIMVKKCLPKEVCKTLIDECNERIWEKHKWNNYADRYILILSLQKN